MIIIKKSFPGHKGIPGHQGGSLPRGTMYGQFGDILNAAPVGKASGAKKWLKANKELYDSNPIFRALANTVMAYTQGGYKTIRDLAVYSVTKTIDESYMNKGVLSDWIRDNIYMGVFAPFLGDMRNYFDFTTTEAGRPDFINVEDVGAVKAAAILQAAISDSKPLDTAMYRGVIGMKYNVYDYDENGNPLYDTWRAVTYPPIPQVGEEFDILGTSSFTTTLETAQQFAIGRARGQGKKRRENLDYAVTYEILPGAHGLNVSALSPWNQTEIITSGKFKVKEVREYDSGIYDPYSYDRGRDHVWGSNYPGYHIVLEQVGVWDVNPSDFDGEVLNGYSSKKS